MIGQQGSLGVSPAELLAAKNMASGKSDMNKEISLGGDLTRLMLAAMQLKKTQAELEKAKLTQGANPQTTVAQDVQQGIAQLQGQPEEQPEGQPQGQPQVQPQGQPQQMAQMDSGIGGLPAGAMDNEDAFAGGGIVAFAAGGIRESGDDKISPEVQAVRDEEMKQLKIAEYARSTPELQALMGKEMRNAGINTAGIANIAPTAAQPENIARQTADDIKQLEVELQRKMLHPDQRNTLLAELNTKKKIFASLPNVAAQGNPDSIASRTLGLASGARNVNAADVPQSPTGIKATLTPSELQAKNDNAALRGVGSSIADIAGTGVAALTDSITSGPRLVARGINALTGRDTIPMNTRTMTPNLDANRAETNKPEVVNYADLPKKPPVAPAAVPAAASNQRTSTDREIGGQKYDPRNVVPTAEDASKPKPFSDDKFLTDEIKSMIDAHRNRVPVTREDRLKQFKADRDEFGLKDEFGKEQVDRLASLAGQAKQDRDVGLWMSAATGFFAMGAGKSRYALQNFAAGAGIGVEQANSALNAYSKRQTELNQSQLEIEKARRAEKRGDLESYRTFTQRAEEKEQAADDRYLTRLTSLFGIKLRGQEIKENRLNREYTQRRDFERKQLDDFRDTLNKDPEYSSAKKAFEGLDQMAILYKDKPAEFAAETRKIQERMKQAEARVKSGYPALGGNSGGAKFLGYE